MTRTAARSLVITFHGVPVPLSTQLLLGACFSPRLVFVAVLGLIDPCLGRSVHALAALSVPVDVTHYHMLLGAPDFVLDFAKIAVRSGSNAQSAS